MATSPAALTADPAAPTFEVEAPNAGTPAAQFEVEKPTTYAPGRAFGLDVARGMGLDADKIKAAEDSGGHDAALKELGSQVLGGLAGFAGNVLKDPAHIADPLNATASALTDALGLPDKGSVFDPANYHRPSPGKLLGALSTIFGGAEAVEKAPGVISKVTPSAESVGRTLRDESGKLKPSVKTAAALTGAGVGHTLGIPGAGELGGLYLGPKIADALIPGREATVAKAVPLSQGPTYPALQAARRAAMKAAQDNAKAELLSSEPATPKISTPTASQAATEVSEGRPATWTNEKVRELAAWGDADAVAQAKARGFGKIPVHFSTAEVTPRSVTRFDAAGNVIEEAGKATTPFDEWLNKTETPEVEHVAEPTGPRGNGSGAPGGGGLEEQARQASGARYFKVSPGGKSSPIIGLGAQDANVPRGWKIMQRFPDGTEMEVTPGVRTQPRYRRE